MYGVKKKKYSWVGLLVAGMFALVCYYFYSNYDTIEKAFKDEFEDFNEDIYGASSDYVPEAVYEISIDAVLGCFATESEGNSVKKAYYIVWLDDGSFAAIEVGSSKMDLFDELTDATWDYAEGISNTLTTTPYEDYVSATGFTGDTNILYRQALSDMGITDDYYVIRDIMLECNQKKETIQTAIICGIFGIILFIILVGMLIPEKKKSESYNPQNITFEARPKTVVSYSHARKRITNPLIKSSYRKLKGGTILLLGAAALWLIIPGCMYAYTIANSNSGNSFEAKYNYSDTDAIAKAKENETAYIIVDEIPELIYADNTDTYYLIENEGNYYIANIDNDCYYSIKKDIEENGISELYGFLQYLPSDVEDDIIETVNNMNDTNYSDFEESFGMYVLNVEEGYEGVGIPVDRIKNFMIISAIFILCLMLFGYSYLTRTINMINGLRHFNDVDYAKLETELSGPNVVKYPQNLYLTENFIVLLFGFSIYKDSSEKNNVTFFADYKDIAWVYPYNVGAYGKITNYGVKVFGPSIDESVILSLPESKINIVESLYGYLQNKCPYAKFGYSEENIDRFSA